MRRCWKDQLIFKKKVLKNTTKKNILLNYASDERIKPQAWRMELTAMNNLTHS